MGLVVEEKTQRKIEDGKRIVFTLSAYTDDFHDENTEGCYSCNIRIFDKNNNIVSEYCRRFLVNKFNENHYKRFINRFATDIEYRNSFDIKNYIEVERDKNLIDERIKFAVGRFNQLGLETKFSCQGTDDEWSDRPCKNDGHSTHAYILFVSMLPKELIKLIDIDKHLSVYGNSIYSSKREYSELFPEILLEIFGKWITDMG